jgi:hypothetical protein
MRLLPQLLPAGVRHSTSTRQRQLAASLLVRRPPPPQLLLGLVLPGAA